MFQQIKLTKMSTVICVKNHQFLHFDQLCFHVVSKHCNEMNILVNFNVDKFQCLNSCDQDWRSSLILYNRNVGTSLDYIFEFLFFWLMTAEWPKEWEIQFINISVTVFTPFPLLAMANWIRCHYWIQFLIFYLPVFQFLL